MAEFKQISSVDVIDTLTKNDNILVIGADGALKQTTGGKGLVVTLENPIYVNEGIIAQNNYDEIYAALMQGSHVAISTLDWYLTTDHHPLIGATFGEDLEVTNAGYVQESIGQWSITDIGLIVNTWSVCICFPNGSHNLPKQEK